MRITIEPTEDQSGHIIQSHSVTITHPSDDLNLDDVVELLQAALKAYGFHFANLIHETNETE